MSRPSSIALAAVLLCASACRDTAELRETGAPPPPRVPPEAPARPVVALHCAAPNDCFVARAEGDTCLVEQKPQGSSCSGPCVANGVCVGTECRGEAASCDDGNVCTDDRCDATRGCVSEETARCESADPCRVAYCDPSTGCATTPAPDGTSCGEATCEGVRVCIAGSCASRPAYDGMPCGEGSACQEGGRCLGSRCMPSPDAGAIRIAWSLPLDAMRWGRLSLHPLPSGATVVQVAEYDAGSGWSGWTEHLLVLELDGGVRWRRALGGGQSERRTPAGNWEVVGQPAGTVRATEMTVVAHDGILLRAFATSDGRETWTTASAALGAGSLTEAYFEPDRALLVAPVDGGTVLRSLALTTGALGSWLRLDAGPVRLVPGGPGRALALEHRTGRAWSVRMEGALGWQTDAGIVYAGHSGLVSGGLERLDPAEGTPTGRYDWPAIATCAYGGERGVAAVADRLVRLWSNCSGLCGESSDPCDSHHIGAQALTPDGGVAWELSDFSGHASTPRIERRFAETADGQGLLFARSVNWYGTSSTPVNLTRLDADGEVWRCSGRIPGESNLVALSEALAIFEDDGQERRLIAVPLR